MTVSLTGFSASRFSFAVKVFRRGPAWGHNFFRNLFDAPVLVLLYHRVADKADDPEMLAVSPARFDSQIAYLREHYALTRFEEDWRAPRCRPMVVVTFDDGYADNYRTALPILQRHGVPATFFVSAGTVGDTRGFWWDRLWRLLRTGDRYPEKLLWDGREYDSANVAARIHIYRQLRLEIKKMNAIRRDLAFAELTKWAGADGLMEDIDRPMSATELLALASSELVTIGSHTICHAELPALPENERRFEIIEGHRALENMVGKRLNTFSYPFGDYDESCVVICREAGFAKAATCDAASARRDGDPMRVPRVIVRDWPLPEFKRQLTLSRWIR